MQILTRTYSSSDRDRMELLIRDMGKLLTKYSLTTLDTITGVRYMLNKPQWDEQVERAIDACVAYDRYFEVSAEVTSMQRVARASVGHWPRT